MLLIIQEQRIIKEQADTLAKLEEKYIEEEKRLRQEEEEFEKLQQEVEKEIQLKQIKTSSPKGKKPPKFLRGASFVIEEEPPDYNELPPTAPANFAELEEGKS